MENIYNCVQFVFVPAFGQHFKEQSVQLCMNMFASCLHLVCGFHQLVLFSQSIKLTVQLCITHPKLNINKYINNAFNRLFNGQNMLVYLFYHARYLR